MELPLAHFEFGEAEPGTLLQIQNLFQSGLGTSWGVTGTQSHFFVGEQGGLALLQEEGCCIKADQAWVRGQGKGMSGPGVQKPVPIEHRVWGTEPSQAGAEPDQDPRCRLEQQPGGGSEWVISASLLRFFHTSLSMSSMFLSK